MADRDSHAEDKRDLRAAVILAKDRGKRGCRPSPGQ